jgi:2-phospho-L-lactate guanylyltransferase
MMREPSWALIPMKRFSEAKSRLRSVLPDPARAALARDMFERVLAAAVSCDERAVVTNCASVAEVSQRAGAHVLWDPPQALGLGGLIDHALRELSALGARRAVVLMGDLPRLEARDVAQLLEQLASCDLAIAPDQRGTCTNALATKLPCPFETAFGDPASFALHAQRARAFGLRVHELESVRIAYDVDVPSDLLDGPNAWAAPANQLR